MRRNHLVAFGLVLGALAGCAPTATDVTPADEAAPSGELVQDDGPRLVAELSGPKTITAGAQPSVAVGLVNTSRRTTFRVVKAGHGSELGYREPHTTWTGTLDRGDGVPTPLTDVVKHGYCGTCLMGSAARWPNDAVALPPGAKLWLEYPEKFEFQRPGRVRLFAHYDYKGGGPDVAKQFPPGALDFLKDVAPFELVSNPIEFDVIRPLDVRLTVRRAVKVNQEVRLSDLLDVRLANLSAEPIACKSPTLHADARLHLEVEGKHLNRHVELTVQSTVYGVNHVLQPGEVVPVLGPGDFANGLDGGWTHPRAERVRVRVVYTTATWDRGSRIASEWVEVVVEE